jgi:hypothetical protein
LFLLDFSFSFLILHFFSSSLFFSMHIWVFFCYVVIWVLPINNICLYFGKINTDFSLHRQKCEISQQNTKKVPHKVFRFCLHDKTFLLTNDVLKYSLNLKK